MAQPLHSEGDHYDGVLVDLSKGPADDTAFGERLQLSVEVCFAALRCEVLGCMLSSKMRQDMNLTRQG